MSTKQSRFLPDPMLSPQVQSVRRERFIVGLTGGIGSGKSWVGDCLAGQGVQVIDTDALAHRLTAPNGKAMVQIEAVFGPRFVNPDGAMNRTMMREHVFAQPEARQQLEHILHPLIQQAVQEALAQPSSLYQVVVVPLLVEKLAVWRPKIDRLCVVDCDQDTQISRVKMRNGLTEAAIRKIIAVQATRETRLAAADDVILNGAQTSLKDLQRQVQSCHATWLKLAQRC